MPTISKMAVLLTGGISGFSASMNSAKKDLDGFTSHFQSAAGTITGIAATLGAGAAAAGIAHLTKNTFETIDANAKLADSLGISTEALTRLQYAASYAGATNEDVSTGLTKMLKNLNEARAGTGAAADALETLGLDAKGLASQSPEAAIAQIADALKGVENPALRVSTAMEIFGKGGAKLLPLLSEGSEGLARFAAEADKLGYSFSRVDAAKVEAANDAVQKVFNVLQGAANQLAIQLAPLLESLANKITDVATSGQGAATTVVAGFGTIVQAVAKAADYLELLKAGWEGMRAVAGTALTFIVDILGVTAEALNKLDKFLGLSTEGTQALVDDLLAAHQALQHTNKEAAEAAKDAFNKFRDGANAKAAAQFFTELQQSAQKAAEAAAETKQAFGGGELAEELDKSGDAAKKAADKIEELRRQVENFGKSKADALYNQIATETGDIVQAETARALQQQLDDLEQAKKEFEEFQKEMDRSADAAAKIGQAEPPRQQTFEPARALRAGSAEAANFVAQIQAQQRGADQQAAMLRTQQQANALLGKIADNTTPGKGGLAVASFN